MKWRSGGVAELWRAMGMGVCGGNACVGGVLACAVLALGGCSERSTPASGNGPSGTSNAPGVRAEQDFAQVYTTRGVVRSLPDTANPVSEFQVQHEEIPEFIGASGEIVGMRTMTMPFPTLAPGVSLAGLKVGDKIGLTFGVVWVQGASRRYPEWTVTRIEPLPADTELDIGGSGLASPG